MKKVLYKGRVYVEAAAGKTPNEEQLAALHLFAKKYGRSWKRELSSKWADGTDTNEPQGALLRQVRNSFGPEWLMKTKIVSAAKKYTAFEYWKEVEKFKEKLHSLNKDRDELIKKGKAVKGNYGAWDDEGEEIGTFNNAGDAFASVPCNLDCEALNNFLNGQPNVEEMEKS
jgi:hypothetical protein